jgi:phytoene/squalene synthetase
VCCLNDMVTDAMRHAPYCLEYMSKLRDPQVFKFCAIPQVMALATLSLCYNNGKVFEGVVKMRRGQTAAVRDRHHFQSADVQACDLMKTTEVHSPYSA